MVATELLKLAMETDEERKERLKKMVATTQLRLAPETEDERRARLEYLVTGSAKRYVVALTMIFLYKRCCSKTRSIFYSLKKIFFGLAVSTTLCLHSRQI